MTIIPKRTTVRVRTTNGGDCVAILALPYRPTYSVAIEGPGIPGTCVITPTRIASVEPVSVWWV